MKAISRELIGKMTEKYSRYYHISSIPAMAGTRSASDHSSVPLALNTIYTHVQIGHAGNSARPETVHSYKRAEGVMKHRLLPAYTIYLWGTNQYLNVLVDESQCKYMKFQF